MSDCCQMVKNAKKGLPVIIQAGKDLRASQLKWKICCLQTSSVGREVRLNRGRMYIRKVLATGLFAVLLNETVCAQYASTNMVGIKAGAAVTSIKSLSGILVSEDYYANYSFTDHMKCSPTAALFYSYHDNDKLFGGQFELLYYQLHASTEYEDINTLNYTADFKYHYVGAGGYVKVYPYQGLFIAPGARFGFCLSPDNVTYESNQEDPVFKKFDYPTNELTQNIMQDKLKGKFDVGVGLQIGWEFQNGLSVQAAYHYSVLDVVETQYNSYNWVEQDNNAHSFQLTVGYALGIDRK